MGLTENTATALLALNGLHVRPNSAVSVEGTEVGLAGSDQKVAVLAPSGSQVISGFEGESSAAGDRTLVLGPMNAANLDALRGLLPWLRPRPLGTRTSAGFGDRLGRATPGHVRALRAAGGELAPIFAQQSIREMERTGRSPQEVLDDATWGVFAEGWQECFGADAGHLKTAGTSYLEALRTVAALDPDLFREIDDISRGRYEEDRTSYYVSASLERAVQREDVPNEELLALLERFDEREIPHVTFGSVLKEARLRDRLMGLLREHPEHYAADLEKHFLRHLEPFANGGSQ